MYLLKAMGLVKMEVIKEEADFLDCFVDVDLRRIDLQMKIKL